MVSNILDYCLLLDGLCVIDLKIESVKCTFHYIAIVIVRSRDTKVRYRAQSCLKKSQI